VDSGTRVSRYLIQDLLGDLFPPMKNLNSMPAGIVASVIACVLWGYLLLSGDISSVWALFGVSNQLMASVGLMIGATIVMRLSKKRIYALTCLIPLAYLFVTVNYAGYWMISNVYLNAAGKGYNLFNAVIASSMLILGFVILLASLKRWAVLWKARGESSAIPNSMLANAV
jgi:carbon starvation protein